MRRGLLGLIALGVLPVSVLAGQRGSGIHWPETGGWPVRIDVHDYTGELWVCGAAPSCEFFNLVEEAVADWEAASRGKLRLVYHRKATVECDKLSAVPGRIVVCSKPVVVGNALVAGVAAVGCGKGGACGRQNRHVDRARIWLADDWHRHFLAHRETTLCHEVGHALGLLGGHNEDPAATCRSNASPLEAPGRLDVRGLDRLYDHRH
jgi:hypothetical protein